MFRRHGRCVLSLRCIGHSLLSTIYLSRIGRIENPSCSACGHLSQDTSYLIARCSAIDSATLALWRLFVSLRSLVEALGCCPASGAPWCFVIIASLGRGSGYKTNNNKNNEFFKEKFDEMPVEELCCNYAHSEKFPKLKKDAAWIICLFGGTYVCKQMFSQMKFSKKARIDLSLMVIARIYLLRNYIVRG